MKLLARPQSIHDQEGPAVAWACAGFYFVLSSSFVVRPLRDEMGIAGGVERLHWLFLGTLCGMLVANPVFSALVARLPSRRFVPLCYRFFALCLCAFWALLRLLPPGGKVYAARAFFIWASVYNLFSVSLFWGIMAERFSSDQGKRLFGLIGAAGTLGSLSGSSVTAGLAEVVGPANLLLVAAVLLEVAVQSCRRLQRDAVELPPTGAHVPGALDGIGAVFRSRYLFAICLYLLLFTLSSTFAYFVQARITAASITQPASRTAFFARMDLWVNLLTLVLQGLVTGRILTGAGIGPTLLVLPALTLVGFIGVGLSPALRTLALFQVARRAADYAIAKPAREVLFTLVGREQKYSSKSFIDTFVYRGGDALGAWAVSLLGSLSLGPGGVALAAVPLSVGWLGVAAIVGRRYRQREAERA